MNQQVRNILTSLGFTQAKGQPMLYEKQIEDMIAYVDFRKKEYAEKGRRFVKKGDNFDIDPDTITDLVEFKRLRDEALQLSKDNPEDKSKREASSGTLGQETTPSVTIPSSLNGVQRPPAPVFNLYEFLYSLVGAGGIIEIFGDTGTLKSILSTLICMDAKKINRSFFYLDTEGKVGILNKKALADDYKYLPIWSEIITYCGAAPKKDLFVLDSLGFPVAAKAAGMRADEFGKALNEMMALVGDLLKAWAYNNNAIVVVINQPKSEYMKSEGELARLGAYGDKVHFAPNLILKSEKTIIPGRYDKDQKKVIPPTAHAIFKSFRSPDFVDDADILWVLKNDNEVTYGLSTYAEKKLKEFKM